MKIEKTSVELVEEENILKKIELAGRICYNSQHLIKEGSYKPFIKKIVDNGHTSVLEHSNIIIKYHLTDDVDDAEMEYEWFLARKGYTESRVHITLENDSGTFFIMVSGNARAWLSFLDFSNIGNGTYDIDENIPSIYSEMRKKYPEIFTYDVKPKWSDNKVVFLTEKEAADINIEHTSYTFKIATERVITQQLVRHRDLSFSQQSQRYINYTLDKNDGEITFIDPERLDDESMKIWISNCEKTEKDYFDMIDKGNPPEVARDVLTNCVKSIIYISGNYLDWQHFIELRTSPRAQDEIRDIAIQIDKKIKKCYTYEEGDDNGK